jgi:hypothetical protein
MLKNFLRAMGVCVAVFLTFHYGQAQIPNQRPETTPARRIGNPAFDNLIWPHRDTHIWPHLY